MQCPFPGMDPYIERPAIWADFHDRFVAEICGALQPSLRPNYAALLQDRLYVVESQRPIYPDVAVVKTRGRKHDTSSGVAVIECDKPTIYEVVEEEIRQPYVEIIEPAAGNRLITAIEVISPDNKTRGPGRRKYLAKRREIRKARANFVEIDLLRAGKPTLRLAMHDFEHMPTWHYLASALTRPRRQEVYFIPLQQRLPTIAIPLKRGDAPVPLNLQSAFAEVWRKGPYPALLGYDAAPPGEMSAEDRNWCERILQKAGMRKAKKSK